MTDSQKLSRMDEELIVERQGLNCLAERISRGLPSPEAKVFRQKFLAAIPVGIDLEPIERKFCLRLLRENMDQVRTLPIAAPLKDAVLSAIQSALECYESVEGLTTERCEAAESAAKSAASVVWAADSAAKRAAKAVWSADWAATIAARAAKAAIGAANDAARAAARATNGDARAAWAATDAVRAAESAAMSAESPEQAAWSTWRRCAEWLIELMAEESSR